MGCAESSDAVMEHDTPDVLATLDFSPQHAPADNTMTSAAMYVEQVRERPDGFPTLPPAAPGQLDLTAAEELAPDGDDEALSSFVVLDAIGGGGRSGSLPVGSASTTVRREHNVLHGSRSQSGSRTLMPQAASRAASANTSTDQAGTAPQIVNCHNPLRTRDTERASSRCGSPLRCTRRTHRRPPPTASAATLASMLGSVQQ
eukprot:CAMPEP_0174852054 /NCGR_PEP_ID=MMETSP1114-20130205/25163_1 /TAXON_ID=312471 /ORGANISM="Neobodo designis, Strain CCAP 1951/1" /LENGTH=201 /DNA_ID=CAMNT_0016086629 /DNA_START=52 /DNA_END=657 /DNA_ORIENTATION=+